MKDKLIELQKGNKVAVFDKKMVFALGALCDKKICCRQDESQFTCWVANEREQMKAFKEWCRVLNLDPHKHKTLQQYIQEGGVIWLA